MKLKSKRTKLLIRGESALAIVLTLAIVINMICFGLMSTLLNLVTGNGTITQSTSDEATLLCAEIAEEGVVLLENDGLLPLDAQDRPDTVLFASNNRG